MKLHDNPKVTRVEFTTRATKANGLAKGITKTLTLEYQKSSSVKDELLDMFSDVVVKTRVVGVPLKTQVTIFSHQSGTRDEFTAFTIQNMAANQVFDAVMKKL